MTYTFMSWFFFALIPPLLDSIIVHIDKYLLSKYFKGGGTGTLLLFSSLIGLAVFPIILFLNPAVIHIETKYALLLGINGFIGALLLLPYFYALEKDDASLVIPLFQMTPIFSFILAFFVLGERLSEIQILGSLMIILGAIIISLDLSGKKPKLKKTVFVAMALASFLYALNSLIYKFVAIKLDFWTPLFWEYAGLSLLGVFLYIFVNKYRREFHTVLKLNRAKILGVNIVNEVIYVISIIAFRYASLLAPLALVWVINGFQPYFVFLLGVLITLFFPKLGKEDLSKEKIYQKLVALYVMFVGLYILNG